MDKRLKGNGTERKVLVNLPAAMHRRIKALASEADKTLDDVVVEILDKQLAVMCEGKIVCGVKV